MRSNDQPVSAILRRLVDEFQLAPKLAQSELRSLWASELGPLINKHTTEVRFRHGKLIVHVDSAALRQELLYNRAHLISELNKKMSRPLIQELVVR